MLNLLNKKIIQKLTKKKLNISVVESCTGGMLSSAITSVSGASKIFSIGLITYSNKAKNSLLKIPNKIINKHGAVSHQCCLFMVKNLYKISKSKICISVTGIAGPSGGTKLKPVGLVFIGVKKGNNLKIYKFIFKNKKRKYIQKSTVNKSLRLILNLLK